MAAFPKRLRLFAIPLAIAGLGPQSLLAEERKQEYVPTAEKVTLIQEPLADVEGKQITIDRYELPPG